jgi:7-carboxy-7-deazaguanine synthase
MSQSDPHVGRLPVSEILYSWQGEGPSIGVPAVFVRFTGCNLHCHWCDTTYASWKAEWRNAEWLTPQKILARIPEHLERSALLIVLTGGEPFLQRSGTRAEVLDELVELACAEAGLGLEFETNGTIRPPSHYDRPEISYNVSPKLPSARAGNWDEGGRWRIQFEFWRQAPRARFKFVLGTMEELAVLDQWVEEYGLPLEKVYVMPEGASREEQLKRLGQSGWIDEVLRRQYRLALRAHTLIWGEDRGR